jgi:SARP family transcriptional regulator, regulator of embCAB operon
VESVSSPATNTLVPPLPENEVLATLEFDGFPRRWPIRRGETVIGRHSDDDVRIRDVRVSRHHARILASGGGNFEIQNLTAVRSEPNPMLVNGQDREHAAVADGDVVTLGGVSFTFRRSADARQLPHQRQRDNI